MNINYNREDNAMAFEDVPAGDVFMFGDDAYIKVYDSEYAIDLATGESQHFGKMVPVTVVEAELNIY